MPMPTLARAFLPIQSISSSSALPSAKSFSPFRAAFFFSLMESQSGHHPGHHGHSAPHNSTLPHHVHVGHSSNQHHQINLDNHSHHHQHSSHHQSHSKQKHTTESTQKTHSSHHTSHHHHHHVSRNLRQFFPFEKRLKLNAGSIMKIRAKRQFPEREKCKTRA